MDGNNGNNKNNENAYEENGNNIPYHLKRTYESLTRRQRELYDDLSSHGSKLPFSIKFSEDALDKESVKYQILHNGLRKVLGIVVSLLKDRVCAENDSPSKKKARIEEYRFEKIGCILIT
ncbi:hypothetical protein C1645_818138 [Glomus cerebriforme]|uniref:Uncharacterized protein n=1 Tax=Glomus cerebriforme TaxID=658196 RepID=A0A397T7U9_9GLOM|nr:hypothetical protein C1645_818138 [Glomus cerebriforme]